MLAAEEEELNSEPRNGIVGIDLMADPRMNGESALCGVGSRLTLVKV
jgi:hypothetical protein